MRWMFIFILIISSFILTGTMGPLFFDFMEHDNNHFCPISSLSEKNCLSINNALNSVVYHISGWQKIFQAIISFNPVLLIVFILTAFFALILKKSSEFFNNKSRFYYQRYLTINEKLFESLKQFLQWLALFNKSDIIKFSFVLARVR